MSNPFDDPEVSALMARHGITHTPGLAADLMEELRPLLAADGIDLDHPTMSQQDLQSALDRAVEQRNLTQFSPIGEHRDRALAILRLAAESEDPVSLVSRVRPDREGVLPAVADVIGEGLGLLDRWGSDATWARALSSARVTKASTSVKPARQVATDLLALAQKSRAFDALDRLIGRHGGLATIQGVGAAVAQAVATRSAQEGRPVGEVAGEMLIGQLPTGLAEQFADTPVAPAEPAAPQRAVSVDRVGASFTADRRGQRRGAFGAQLERARLRAFETWLRRQPEIDAPSVEDEVRMLEAAFQVARGADLEPLDPTSMGDLLDVVMEIQPDEAGDVRPPLILTLHAYTHFGLELDPNDPGWNEAHELVEDELIQIESESLIDRLVTAAHQIGEDERLAALRRTLIVTATAELLHWLGSGRAVTSTGALRRADIAPVAALLGRRVEGVAKHDPDPAPPDGSGASSTLKVMSMYDVPELAAWWAALQGAELIEVGSTRVRPGPLAREWLAPDGPPLASAERLAGLYVAYLLVAGSRPGWGFEQVGTAYVIRMLLSCLPDSGLEAPGTPPEEDFVGRIAAGRVARTVQRLTDAGLLSTLDGRLRVESPLQVAAVTGVAAAIATLANDESDELD